MFTSPIVGDYTALARTLNNKLSRRRVCSSKRSRCSRSANPSLGIPRTKQSWRTIAQAVTDRSQHERSVAAARDRIARAALALLLEQPYEDVTLAQIAEAAGVSHQTVLNHFASKEGVAFAAAELLRAQTGEARAKAPVGRVHEALAVLVDDYERIGDANARWAIASERLGSLAPLLDDARAGHRDWLARIFADSLPSQSAARRRALYALHAATDVYTWKLLRRDLKRSRAETIEVMEELVRGILRLDLPKRTTRSKR